MKGVKNTYTYPSLQKQGSYFITHRLSCICYFMVCLLIVSIFLGLRPVYITGCSMSPTLKPGSLCIAKDINDENSLPERGSIVIFYSGEDNGILYVKRLIGLPGDSLSAENDVLTINGMYYDTVPGTGDWIADVPDGYAFFMGDNRGDSWDSRRFGCVPLTNLVGKILF